jgi:hypothetical protein
MLSLMARQKFKQIYETKKDTVEYMLRFGNSFERAEAAVIKEIAIMENTQGIVVNLNV